MLPFDMRPAIGLTPSQTVRTPKISIIEKRTALFPYYAGFAESFVVDALDRMGADRHATILDPWNGGGTTSFVAATRGAKAVGTDLNPILTSIARARSAKPKALAAAQAALEDLRRRSVPVDAKIDLHRVHSELLAKLSEDPAASALIDTAVYRFVREANLGNRSKNPVWFKAGEHTASEDADSLSAFLRNAEQVLNIQASRASEVRVTPKLLTAAFDAWRGATSDRFDFVLTSPPYLTRIDYVMATLPELRHHATRSGISLADMRRQMLGTPLTDGVSPSVPSEVGPTALKLLSSIYEHPSKASKTYYRNFYAKYLVGLLQSLRRLSHTLKSGGQMAIVVQSSQYKEIFVDLPGIISEMADHLGIVHESSYDYPQSRSMVGVNKRAIGYTDFKLSETAMFLRKNVT